MAYAAPPLPVTHVRDYTRRTFAPRHLRVVETFAEALFHDPGAPFEPGQLEALAVNCDQFVSPASKTLRFGLRAILDVVRWLPLLVIGKLATFEELSLADRMRMLERMDRARPPLPLMLVAYKTILAMLFFEDPKELAATGYPGPERRRWKLGLVKDATGTRAT
jgi:hypothetical protein